MTLAVSRWARSLESSYDQLRAPLVLRADSYSAFEEERDVMRVTSLGTAAKAMR